MSRPRRNSIQQICDAFCDLPIPSQDGMLVTLGELHRQAKRREARQANPEQPDGEESDSVLEGMEATE